MQCSRFLPTYIVYAVILFVMFITGARWLKTQDGLSGNDLSLDSTCFLAALLHVEANGVSIWWYVEVTRRPCSFLVLKENWKGRRWQKRSGDDFISKWSKNEKVRLFLDDFDVGWNRWPVWTASFAPRQERVSHEHGSRGHFLLQLPNDWSLGIVRTIQE